MKILHHFSRYCLTGFYPFGGYKLGGADGGADVGHIIKISAPTLNTVKSISYPMAGQMGQIFLSLTREGYRKNTCNLSSRVKREEKCRPICPAKSKRHEYQWFRVGRIRGSDLPRICPTCPSTNHAKFMLDERKLERVRHLSGGGIEARCPACAAADEDNHGNHLKIDAQGRFCCVKYMGADGKQHRREIWKIAGVKDGKGKTEFRPPPIRYRLRMAEV